MAKLRVALTPDEVKKTGVAEIRKAYNDLAFDYNKITEGKLFYCHSCDAWHPPDAFYSDKRFASGLYPECKKSLLLQATDYDKKTNTYTDNREKTIEVFKKLNLIFSDALYRSALTSSGMDAGEKIRQTAYQHMITIVKSLPQYKDKDYSMSEFDDELSPSDEEINENSRILKTAKKRFGKDYTPQDLIWLENEYQDWVKRYPCENKSQEILYKQICFIELNIDKAQRDGKDTKDLLKSLQDVMSSLQIKPSQNGSNALTEAKTFGQLIEKWEDEWDGGKPIPEPDPDFADRDNVIRYIDTFFKGHLAKMMGLKNGFSRLYDKFISKFTVNTPQYDEDTDSEAIFDQLFGKNEDTL